MELDPSRDHLPSSADFVDQLITELSSIQPEQPSNTTAPTGGELDPLRTQTTHKPKQPQNPLSRLSPSQLAKVKPLLLTLHCLFPNDLLPALDILDRGLVQRLVVRADRDIKIGAVPTAPTQDQDLAASTRNHEIQHDETNPSTGFDTITPDDGHASHSAGALGGDCLFLVTSASSVPVATSSISISTSTQEPQKAYEVRLNAWNCTCPTFTLSAFRDLNARLASTSTPITPAERPSNPAMLCDWDADADGGSGSGVAAAAAAAVYPFGGTLTCTTDRDSPPACKHILACLLFARCAGLFGGGGEVRGALMEEVAGWCAGWGG